MLERIFLRALNLSVAAGYIILAVMVLRLILRRAPRWMSCALWALAALRLVCPFSLESALSLLPSGEAIRPAVLELEEAAPETVFIHTGFETVDRPANAALHAAARQAPSQEIVESQAAAPVQTVRSSSVPTLLGAASVIWLAGMTAMVLYGAVSYLRLRRRVRTAVLWKEDMWQCETVDAPFVLGVIKPRIYLPFYMDPVAAAQVIAHERAHIRRHDQLTKVFAWLLLSAYWFDPLVWAAYALLCRDIELACDERVVRDMSTEARQRYARALLNWGVDKPAVAACPLAFGEVGLKERIKTVMKYKKPARWAAVLAVALIAASGVCLLTSPMAEAVAPAQSVIESAPFLAAAENEQTPAPTAETDLFAADRLGLDPDAVPEPVPILTVRPRDLTADEAKTIVTAIFGDAPVYKDIGRTKQELAAAIERAEQILADVQAYGDEWYIGEAAAALEDLRQQYETAPDDSERELCDWTFRPQEGDILARSSLDGVDYVIEVMDPGPQGTPGADCLMIYKLDDGPIPAQTTAPTGAQIDALTGQVSGWLDKMGLENYTVAATEVTDDTGAVVIFAQPSYNGVVQLPFDWRRDPFADQTLWFSFLGGELDTCIYSSPLEVVASQPPEELMSLRDALTAAGLEDSMAEHDWRLCYTRVPDADDSGDDRLVPSYRYGTVSGSASDTGILIVSAVDGALLTDTRPTDTQPSPTPAPAVVEIEVRWGIDGPIDYVESGWFSLPSGQSIDLYAIWYPLVVSATPEWTVDDESVATVQPDETGIRCHCELVGASGTETVLHVKVNEKQEDIRIIVA